MKTICISLSLLMAMIVLADIVPPPAASVAEVNAGVVKNKYVSPFTLNGWSGSPSGTNVYTGTNGINVSGTVISTDGSVLRTNNISNITNIVDTSSFGYSVFITNNTGSNLWISLSVSLFPGPSSSLPLIINNTANGGGIVTNTVSIVTNNANMMLCGFVGPSGYYGLIGGANAAVTSWQRVYSPLAQSISVTGGSGTTYTNNGTLGAGVISGSGIGTKLSSAQLAAQGVVTNGAVGTSLSDLAVSNATYGGIALNRLPAGNEGAIDSFGGRLWLHGNGAGGLINLANYSGATVSDFYGNTSYGGLSVGSPDQLIPFSLQWQFLPNSLRWSPGVPATMFSPIYAGSGSGLEDLPVSAQATAQGMPTVPFIFTTWTGGEYGKTQTNVFYIMNDCTTNPIFGTIKSVGMMPYGHLDDDCLFITNNRQSGLLAINTAAYPDGTNFIRLWKTNGWNMMLTEYNSASPSAEYIGGLGHQYPLTTPNKIHDDIATYYDWGLDYRSSDTTSDTGTAKVFSRGIASGILTPTVNHGTYNDVWSNPYSFAYGKPLGYLQVVYNIGYDPATLWDEANIITTDGYHINDHPDFPGQITNATGAIALMNQFRACYTNWVPRMSRGHWAGPPMFSFTSDFTSTNIGHVSLSSAVMINGVYNIAHYTNQTLNTTYPIMMGMIANNTNLFLAWTDYYSKVINLSDSGATNVSKWAKPMKDGSILVGLVNEQTSGSSNLTVNLAAYPFTVNNSYTVTNIFTGENLGTSNTSFTLNITNGDAALLRFHPSLNASQLNGPVPDANLGSAALTNRANTFTADQEITNATLTTSNLVVLGKTRVSGVGITNGTISASGNLIPNGGAAQRNIAYLGNSGELLGISGGFYNGSGSVVWSVLNEFVGNALIITNSVAVINVGPVIGSFNSSSGVTGIRLLTNSAGSGIAYSAVITRPTNIFSSWTGTMTNWVYWNNAGTMTKSATNVNAGGWVDVIQP